MIKYNIKTVNDWLYNSNPIKGMYYNGRRVYRRFVANGQPTPPVFDGKFKAEYSDGRSYSAECDGNTALKTATTNPSGYEYSAMTSAEVGQCVNTIGNDAFRSSSISAVTIGSGVTLIADRAFRSCSSLTSINIPSGVTTIGSYAFAYCSSLTSITVKATTPPTLGSDAFKGSTCPIYVPDASVDIYKTTSVWSSYASRIKPISEKPQ